MHKGVDNGGRTLFMGANVKMQPLSLSPVEVALIDQRRLNLEEIGRVYDLSGPVMNDLDARHVQQRAGAAQRAVPRCAAGVATELIEQTLQAQLIDPSRRGLTGSSSFDLTDKLKGDPVQLASR
jgi:phage portal protein BeeE